MHRVPHIRRGPTPELGKRALGSVLSLQLLALSFVGCNTTCNAPDAHLAGTEYLTDILDDVGNEDTASGRYATVDAAGSIATAVAADSHQYFNRDTNPTIIRSARYEPDVIRRVNGKLVFAFGLDFETYSSVELVLKAHGREIPIAQPLQVLSETNDAGVNPHAVALNSLHSPTPQNLTALREYRLDWIHDIPDYTGLIDQALAHDTPVMFNTFTSPNSTVDNSNSANSTWLTRYQFLVPTQLIPRQSDSWGAQLQVRFKGTNGGSDGQWASVNLVQDSVIDIGVVGDSIAWGQGVTEDLKWYTLVGQTLMEETGRAVRIHRFAHSGAKLVPDHNVTTNDFNSILHASASAADLQACHDMRDAYLPGEIPNNDPAIFCQLLETGDIEETPDLDMVVTTGCANDVTIQGLFGVPPNELESPLHQVCRGALDSLIQVLQLQSYEGPAPWAPATQKKKMIPVVLLQYPNMWGTDTSDTVQHWIDNVLIHTISPVTQRLSIEAGGIIGASVVAETVAVGCAAGGPAGCIAGTIIGVSLGLSGFAATAVAGPGLALTIVDQQINDYLSPMLDNLSTNAARVSDFQTEAASAGLAGNEFLGQRSAASAQMGYNISSHVQDYNWWDRRAYFGKSGDYWLFSPASSASTQQISGFVKAAISPQLDKLSITDFFSGSPDLRSVVAFSPHSAVPGFTTEMAPNDVANISPDPMLDQRLCECRVWKPVLADSAYDRNLCYLAAELHPNVQGNRAEAQAVLASLHGELTWLSHKTNTDTHAETGFPNWYGPLKHVFPPLLTAPLTPIPPSPYSMAPTALAMQKGFSDWNLLETNDRVINKTFLRQIHAGQCYQSKTNGNGLSSLECTHRRLFVPLPREPKSSQINLTLFPTATNANMLSSVPFVIPDNTAANFEPVYHDCVYAWPGNASNIGYVARIASTAAGSRAGKEFGHPPHVGGSTPALPTEIYQTKIDTDATHTPYLDTATAPQFITDSSFYPFAGAAAQSTTMCVEDEFNRFLDRPAASCTQTQSPAVCGGTAWSQACLTDGDCNRYMFCDNQTSNGGTGSYTCRACDPTLPFANCPLMVRGQCRCRTENQSFNSKVDCGPYNTCALSAGTTHDTPGWCKFTPGQP